MSPIRVQRSRVAGWKNPTPKPIYVGRPSKWGNPWKVVRHGKDEWALMGWYEYDEGLYEWTPLLYGKKRENLIGECLARYFAWVNDKLVDEPDFLEPLKGKNLSCFCALDQLCHADILLRMAN